MISEYAKRYRVGKSCLVTPLVLVLSLFVIDCVAAHPFHVSVGEMQYDADAKMLEIALRVWPVDLERSIKRRLDVSVDLDADADAAKKSADDLIAKYLRTAFNISNAQKQAIEIEWIGREAEGSHIWIYLQLPIEEERTLEGLHITNRICFESLHDQVNTIKVKNGDDRKVLQFTREEPTAVLKSANGE